MARALLFAITGLGLFSYWAIALPSSELMSDMQAWPHVLWFSTILALLAIALPVLGRLVGGRWALRSSMVAGAGIGLSSVANVFEDGFRIEAFFGVFIIGTIILHVGSLAMVLAVWRTAAGQARVLAVVPALTVAAVLSFPIAGGPLGLAAWLIPAGYAISIRRKRVVEPSRV